MARALRPAVAGGSARLAYLLSRYGEAIRYDLACRGWDLAVLWQQRRWRFLLCLLDRLPRTSAYIEAVADDEDAVGQADDNRAPAPPRMSEWSPTVEHLAAAVDRLGEVINAVLVAGGGKPTKLRPLPRPVTAAHRVRHKQRRASHDRVRGLVEEARARAAQGGD